MESNDIKKLPFIKDVKNAGGRIYQVGGAVRDKLLGRESKDLDIVISNISVDQLVSILSNYGKVSKAGGTEGGAFGVLKVKLPDFSEEIDVALPRTEKSTGKKHTDFEVQADPNIPIEKDLERRDATINSMAVDDEDNIIDPYGGQNDIQNKIIRVTNPDSFSDDPLRMLRAIMFASRFNFTIEPKTFNMIRQNASDIKEITSERIILEFEKIVYKGDPYIGAKLLIDSNLYLYIFNDEYQGNLDDFKNVFTVGEFFYILSKNIVQSPSELFKTKFKGNNDTVKEIRALEQAFNNNMANMISRRLAVHEMTKISPQTLNSKILPQKLQYEIRKMQNQQLPLTLKDLAVDGYDVKNMGYTGQEIGQTLHNILHKIYAGELVNNKGDIMDYLENNKLYEFINNFKKLIK